MNNDFWSHVRLFANTTSLVKIAGKWPHSWHGHTKTFASVSKLLRTIVMEIFSFMWIAAWLQVVMNWSLIDMIAHDSYTHVYIDRVHICRHSLHILRLIARNWLQQRVMKVKSVRINCISSWIRYWVWSNIWLGDKKKTKIIMIIQVHLIPCRGCVFYKTQLRHWGLDKMAAKFPKDF